MAGDTGLQLPTNLPKVMWINLALGRMFEVEGL